MTLKEFYTAVDGDYGGVTARLQKEALVARFVKMFLKDDLCTKLCRAMERGEVKEAFQLAHTLKGNCLNLGLTRLLKTAEAVTEPLRAENSAEAMLYLDALVKEYQRTAEAINQLD